jgi:pimeloyl-ACP methyl ester carboxylesterase
MVAATIPAVESVGGRMLAAVLVCLGVVGSAAAGPGDEPGGVTIEATKTGVRFGTWGGPQAAGPAPTLVILANSIEGTLGDKYFRQAGRVLGEPQIKTPHLCVSIDLPCHGQEQVAGEPPELRGWRHRLEHGGDIVGDTVRRAVAVIDHLVAEGRVDPDRIGAVGTSRGGFMALHLAAAEPRIACVVAYSPVTDLGVLREFRGAEELPAVRAASIFERIPQLAGRPLWLTIGANDDRVGTKQVLDLGTALLAAAREKNRDNRCSVHVDGETEGHQMPAVALDQSVIWLRRVLRPPRKPDAEIPASRALSPAYSP